MTGKKIVHQRTVLPFLELGWSILCFHLRLMLWAWNRSIVQHCKLIVRHLHPLYRSLNSSSCIEDLRTLYTESQRCRTGNYFTSISKSSIPERPIVRYNSSLRLLISNTPSKSSATGHWRTFYLCGLSPVLWRVTNSSFTLQMAQSQHST
jgi:hypothetical protein